MPAYEHIRELVYAGPDEEIWCRETSALTILDIRSGSGQPDERRAAMTASIEAARKASLRPPRT